MKISQEKFERLQQFLDAEMNQAEIAAFEEEVKTDPDLKDQLDLQIKLVTAFSEKKRPGSLAIEANDDETLRSILSKAKHDYLKKDNDVLHIASINTSHTSTAGHKRPAIIEFPYWLAAASVIALAFIAALVYYSTGIDHAGESIAHNMDTSINKKQPIIVSHPPDTIPRNIEQVLPRVDYAAISQQYYTKDKGPDDNPPLLASEISDYNAGSYESIQAFDADNIPKVRGVVNEFEIKELGHYYKGLSFIETKNYPEAISNLQWVIDSSRNSSLQIKARWYQALVYLKKGDFKKSEPLLMFVAVNKQLPIYKAKAEALLSSIKKST